MGPGWVAYRPYYTASKWLGVLERKTPILPWDAQPLSALLSDVELADPARYLAYRRSERAPRFFFRPDDRERYQPMFAQWDTQERNPVLDADDILRGRFRFFSFHEIDTGLPPDWRHNHFTGEDAPRDRHWSQIDTFGFGDIKTIWELSRFAWAYTLVRAYWRTGDERYPEAFWDLLEDWRTQNPPNLGPSWMCGQECALRLMAWCFALYGFLLSPATTPVRAGILAQMVVVSASRIRANIRYALSQRNNHGLSEAVGLWTVGTLFPEFPRAARWRRLGRGLLARLASELIYEDGPCSQNSVIYERLMLHDLLFAARVGECNGSPLPTICSTRASAAAELLFRMQDGTTGEAPLYGPSDGSLILPLSNAGYRDLRPVVQAGHYLSGRTKPLEPGPWDEDLLWLGGPEAAGAAPDRACRPDLRAEQRGYYTLRSPSGHAFVRCGDSARGHRPGHEDQLHVDVWWRGLNIACDPGTYSYNSTEPWAHGLHGAACHNVVTVDGRGQSERVGRFLSLPWPVGRRAALVRSPGGGLAYFEGEHDAYHRLQDPVVHRRGVLRLGDEHWLVVDRLTSSGMHDYRLHWLLPDRPVRQRVDGAGVALQTEHGPYDVRVWCDLRAAALDVVRADVASSRGWQSRHYLSRGPALSVATQCRARSVSFVSLLGPPCECHPEGRSLSIAFEEGSAMVKLSQGSRPVGRVILRRRPGPDEDSV